MVDLLAGAKVDDVQKNMVDCLTVASNLVDTVAELG